MLSTQTLSHFICLEITKEKSKNIFYQVQKPKKFTVLDAKKFLDADLAIKIEEDIASNTEISPNLFLAFDVLDDSANQKAFASSCHIANILSAKEIFSQAGQIALSLGFNFDKAWCEKSVFFISLAASKKRAIKDHIESGLLIIYFLKAALFLRGLAANSWQIKSDNELFATKLINFNDVMT